MEEDNIIEIQEVIINKPIVTGIKLGLGFFLVGLIIWFILFMLFMLLGVIGIMMAV